MGVAPKLDVAKGEIVVACSEGGFPVREVANQRAAVLAFLKGLPAGSRIGVESTGTYHELFAGLAHQLGFLVQERPPRVTAKFAGKQSFEWPSCANFWAVKSRICQA